MATAKQAITIATQRAFAVLDLAVEMCTRPWIVELLKKSQITSDAVIVSDYVLASLDGNCENGALTR